MDAESLYFQLRQVVSEMPDLSSAGGSLTPEKMAWLGRAYELVAEANGHRGVEPHSFRLAADHLHGLLRDPNAIQIGMIVYRALAAAEARAPAAVRGSFIAVGAGFDVFQVASKILGAATKWVLIVDPYMDATAFTDFAILAPEGIPVNLLCDSASTKTDAVVLPFKRWTQQYGNSRPLQLRMTDPKRLHDRLIFVDDKVWSLTQSLKDFAKRSPASVQVLDAEIAQWKTATYSDEWNSARPPQ